MSTGNKHDSGAAQGAQRATEQAPESSLAGGGRWSAKRKMSVVLELLRGADLEATSRKHEQIGGGTAHVSACAQFWLKCVHAQAF